MTRAAIYARVSSQAQRENQTIESQLRVLPAYVTAQGWTLVGTYIDDGKSAKTGRLDRRDGFARLLADAERRLFDVLVVIDIDRLTRTDDMRERAQILGPFQTAGIRIVTPSGGDLDLRTMLGELYVTLQALFAAEENRKRARRAAAGQVRRAQDGGKPKGRTPYGLAYDAATHTWSLHPEQAEVVREIYQRFISGESCRTIAAALHARGLPAPVDVWYYRLVWRIVKARYPAGEWLANSRERILVRVPAIVDEATWQRAQMAIDKNKATTRRTKHTYLVSGLAVCGVCGGRMVIKAPCGGKPSRYECKQRRAPRPGTPKCTAITVKTSDADARVWERVALELADPALPGILADRAHKANENCKAWRSDVPKLEAGLARLLKTEDALWTRFRRGGMPEPILDSQLAGIRKERGFIEEQLAAARAAAEPDAPAVDPAEWVRMLRDLVAVGSPEARLRVVRAVVKRVEFRGRDLHVTMRLGADVFHSLKRPERNTPIVKSVVLRAVN